ncbi:MAG: response regulator [Thermonemataceae bacterium]|nr:response regulator [Thermonemataceae bacterium]
MEKVDMQENYDNYSLTELKAEVERLKSLVDNEPILNKLQESNAALQDLLDNSHDLIFVCNAKGQILFANKTFSSKLGYSLSELPQLSIKALLSNKHKVQFLKQLSLVLQKKEVDKFNLVLLHKNQKLVYLKGTLSVRHDEQGQLLAVRGILYDTTDRVQIQSELMSQTARLKAIFESGSHIMWSVNRKREFTSFNQNYVLALQIQYGIKPEIGKNTESLKKALANDSLATFWKEKMKKAFAGEIQYFEIKARNIFGETIWQDVYLNPIPSPDGNIDEVSAIAHDITDKKKANEDALKAKELAEHLLKVKESFLANMSHEIRTPMNGIIGMIELLADTQLDEKQKDYVHTIKKSSETLMTILNDILDLSKIEAGKMSLLYKPFDLKQTIEKVFHLFLPQATHKKNTLSIDFDEQIPDCIIADETRLIQILSNLCSNAIKFTENGSVKIKVRLIEKTTEELYIQVDVLDSGIGISKENQKKLFQSFSQLDNSLSKSQSGTGLGLVISKHLVELMQGEIGILENTETPTGSNFFFSFKAQVCSENNEKIAQEEIIGFQPFQKSLKVLLVDDNAINRKVASEMLKKIGLEVFVADSGKMALQKIQQETFDIIFMDIQMPELDGVETMKLIRQIVGSKSPKMIALTAYAMQEDKNKFLQEGFDGYLAKPLKIERIHQVINFLENKNTTNTENIESATVDFSIWEQLRNLGGIELLTESIQECITETKDIQNHIQTALKERDFGSIQKDLHTLKGVAATLGIKKFAEKTVHLEKLIKTNDTTNFEQELSEWLHIWEVFVSTYPKILEKWLSN